MEKSIRTLWLCVTVTGMMTGTSLLTASGATAVYECNVNGQRIFSDQACAPNAVTRDIGESNRMQGHVVTRGSHAEEKTSRRVRQSEGDDLTTLKQKCNKLRSQQEAIVSKERAGYNAKQGQRLRERSDELKLHYQALRCERYK